MCFSISREPLQWMCFWICKIWKWVVMWNSLLICNRILFMCELYHWFRVLFQNGRFPLDSDSYCFICRQVRLSLTSLLTHKIRSNVDKISEMKKSQTDDSPELKKKIQNQTLQSNLLKVGVNFIQTSTVILTFQLEWPEFVINFFFWALTIYFNRLTTLLALQIEFSPPIKMDSRLIVLSLWVPHPFFILVSTFIVKGNNQDLYFIQYIANLIEPFGLWLIIILFYMLYLKVTAQSVFSNPKLKQTLFVLFLIIGFLLQPNIIQTSFSLFA